jgi:thiol-disulfide isomerase/thioredoxin
LLAESVVQEFAGRVRFVAENFADSQLARRFGVSRYPAIFVDDVLVATPKDFGFFGKGEGPDVARYAPFQSAEGHQHFRADLQRAIGLVLAGHKATAQREAPAATAATIATLPAFTVTDLDGKELSSTALAGRPVLVEFWATWCPPCRATLKWLGQLRQRYGDRLAVLTLAVDSDQQQTRELAKPLAAGIHWAVATPELGRKFGDVSALPTMFLFAGSGATAAVFYGAPPSLHADAEARLEQLLR